MNPWEVLLGGVGPTAPAINALMKFREQGGIAGLTGDEPAEVKLGRLIAGKGTPQDMEDLIGGFAGSLSGKGVAGALRARAAKIPGRFYHGTHGNFPNYRANIGASEFNLPDSMLGPHFAKDPRVSGVFAMREGGNIRPATLYGKLYDVLQKPYESGAIQSDQVAISGLIADKVFPKRKDLFVNWITKARRVTKKEANVVWEKLLKGETPTGADVPELARGSQTSFGDYIGNFDGTLHGLGQRGKQQMVREFRKAMRAEGYTGLRYKNTAPMETKNYATGEMFNPESVVMFDPRYVRGLPE